MGDTRPQFEKTFGAKVVNPFGQKQKSESEVQWRKKEISSKVQISN